MFRQIYFYGNGRSFFVYGSLSSRDSVSRETLKELLAVAKYKIFDVNLRIPHYTKTNVLDLLNEADFLKFNDGIRFQSDFISCKFNVKYISMFACVL